MKPRNREINIFNMSLLDVLCGALGAFCFLMLSLFPYYTKAAANDPELAEKYRQEKERAEKLQKDLNDSEDKLDETKKDLEDTQEKKREAENNLFVVMTWETAKHDIDLWVERSGGEWSGPGKKTVPGIKADEGGRTDSTSGPGTETFWLSLPAGRYKLGYVLYDRKGNPENPWVRCTLFTTYREGDKKWMSTNVISPVMLTTERQLRTVGTIEVDSKGGLGFAPAAG